MITQLQVNLIAWYANMPNEHFVSWYYLCFFTTCLLVLIDRLKAAEANGETFTPQDWLAMQLATDQTEFSGRFKEKFKHVLAVCFEQTNPATSSPPFNANVPVSYRASYRALQYFQKAAVELSALLGRQNAVL